MKKTMALVMALVLLMLCSMPAYAAGTPLFKSAGVELRLLKWQINGSTGDASIYMEIQGINNNDHKVWIYLEDANVDGVPVTVSLRSIPPHTDTGEDSPLLFNVWGDNDGGAASDAIKSGKKLEMRVVIQDNDTYEKLASETVEISLEKTIESKPASSYSSSSSSSSSYSSSYSTPSYAPAYTPASTNYKTLKKGSKGQAVRDLQQRLTDLGYLNDRVDGSFGRNTTTAVRSFLDQNGLTVGNEATPEMQSLLYSSRAQYYVEPYIPLVIGQSFTQETPLQTKLDNTGFMKVMLVNRSSTRGIRGYVLSYYNVDMYGNKLDLTDGRNHTHLEFEEMNYIEPAHYKDAFNYVIQNYYRTYAVYVGVQKIVFDDGEVREVSLDDVEYFECPIHR